MSKTSQFKTACKDNSGYIAQLKQQKIKIWSYLAAHWHYGDVPISNITFSIFAVLKPLYNVACQIKGDRKICNFMRKGDGVYCIYIWCCYVVWRYAQQFHNNV